MKRVFLFLSVIILLGLIYLMILNFNNYTSLHLLYDYMLDVQTKVGMSEQGAYFVRAIRTSTLILTVLSAGLFIGAGTVYMFLSASKDKVRAYQRELERTSVSGSANASRVEVLEAKIKTLEKAFTSVVDERTKLEVQIKNLNAEIDNLNK